MLTNRPPQLFALLLALLMLGSLSPAQATTYNYDGNGRLRSVTNSSGVSATYDYDSRGNLIRIGSDAASQMFIASFEPNNGPPGDQVTIFGSGFAALTSRNTVKFNGVSATIVTASTTKLVVTVPQTAPPGSAPISVTNITSGTTVTSRDNFTVTAIGAPPSVTSFVDTSTNTTSGLAGDTLTINGQSLNPISGETAVQIDGIYVMPISISNTQIQVVIPAYAGSGPITVTTPYGSATTTTNFFVLPFGYTPSNVTTYQTPLTMGGAAQSVSLTTTPTVPTGNAALLFQGSFGDYVSLQTSSFSNSTATMYYSVFSPTGTLISGSSAGGGLISASNPSIHLPRLNSTGTYMVFLYQASSAMTFSVAAEKNAAIPVNGPSTVVPTTIAGQGKRLTFVANGGDNLGLGITGVSVAGGGSIFMRVYLPNNGGAFSNQLGLQAQTCSPPKCSFGLFSLPTTGTYIVTITPSSPTTTFSLTATLSSAVIVPLPATNTATPMNLSASGQVGIYTFTGNANQQVALQFVSSGSGVGIQVDNPDGSVLISNASVTSANAYNKTLTQTGTYKVLVWLNDISASGGVSASLVVTPPPGQLAAGGSLSVSDVLGGQTESFTFTANAGDSLGLEIGNLVITNSTLGWVSVTAKSPSGASIIIGSNSICYAPQCNYNLFNLTETGTYTVLVDPSYATATFSLLATLSNTVIVPLPATNTATPMNLGTVGQNGIYTFTGTAGQQVAFQITPTGADIAYQLNNPDGSFVFSDITSAGTPRTYNKTLSQTGTYKLYVSLNNGGSPTGTVSAKLAVTPPPAQLTAGGSLSVSDVLGGQTESFTFTANAGDNLGLEIGNLVITNSTLGWVSVTAKSPSGASIIGGSSSICYAPQCNYNLFNLTETGTYTVLVDPNNATATFSLLATLSQTQIVQLPATNTPTTMNLGTVGQNGIYTFTGTANQQVTLQFTPTGNGIGYSISNPDGTTLVASSSTTSGTPVTKNLTLPQNGTTTTPYKLYISLLNGGSPTATVSATLH